MSALDLFLWSLLADDLDIVLPMPPRVPSFACSTVRPGRRS